MSTFRAAVNKLGQEEFYVMLSDTPLKASIKKINDDLVILQLANPLNGVSELGIHIDRLVLASK